MSTSLAVEKAKAALERGDYRQCLTFLEPLTKIYPLSSQGGGEIRMLMITAWMGQGDDQKAIATCKLLTKTKDPEIRQQAKQLISILEAPNLPRPENWSIQIPHINLKQGTWANKSANRTKDLSKPSFNHPPTGPTKAFDLTFSIIAIVILIILTIFLSN